MNTRKSSSGMKDRFIIEAGNCICTLEEFLDENVHKQEKLDDREILSVVKLQQGRRLFLKNFEVLRLQ
jgi:hypothetical protein